MAVTYLTISYPNFVLGQIIDPEEANQNNLEITDKVNEMVDAINGALTNITSLQTNKVDTTAMQIYVQQVATNLVIGQIPVEILGEQTVYQDQNVTTQKYKMVVIDGKPFLEVIAI